MDLEKKKILFKSNLPENYFNDLEKKIYAQIKIDAMQDLNHKQEPYYFNDLEKRILSKTTKKTLTKWQVWRNVKWYAAAVVLIISTLGFWYTNSLQTSELDQLTAQEIELYLDQEANLNIEIEDLIVENQNTENVFFINQLNDLNEAEIKEYLY